MITYKTGDLFTSTADVIGHGTNVDGKMHSGIAVEFRNRYYTMHKHYVKLCASVEPERLVGKAAVWVNEWEDDFDWGEKNIQKRYVANLFSQDRPGPNARYDWTVQAINNCIIFMHMNGLGSLAIPRIGCGVGGLDWNVMQAHLHAAFDDSNVEIELWSLA